MVILELQAYLYKSIHVNIVMTKAQYTMCTLGIMNDALSYNYISTYIYNNTSKESMILQRIIQHNHLHNRLKLCIWHSHSILNVTFT